MGQIIGNLGQAKTYKAQASVALGQGRAQKAAASKRAFNLEEEARSDSILAGKNMMRQRENQTAAQATVRNAVASSGFTSQGSGQQAEIATADIFETAIRDMALSNAISDSNKRYAADVSRYQGDLAMQQAEAAASQYNSLAKTARTSALIQGIGSVGAGALGYALGYQQTDPVTGKTTTMSGWKGAQAAYSNAYDLSGSMLQWAPGTVTAGRNSSVNAGNSIFQLFAQLFPGK